MIWECNDDQRRQVYQNQRYENVPWSVFSTLQTGRYGARVSPRRKRQAMTGRRRPGSSEPSGVWSIMVRPQAGERRASGRRVAPLQCRAPFLGTLRVLGGAPLVTLYHKQQNQRRGKHPFDTIVQF